MARTKSETTTATPKKKSVAVEKNTDNELDMLKSELAKALATIKELTEAKQSVQTTQTKSEKLDAEEPIPVISQCVGKLSLSTEGYGLGEVYDFEEFGEIVDIPFGDLKMIVRNNKRFTQDGLFYIANEDAVKQLRLSTLYNKLLKNEDIINLFKKDANTIVELYKLAPEGQKNVIIDMIVDKKLAGEDVDITVLATLGNLSGKDLMNIEKDTI